MTRAWIGKRDFVARYGRQLWSDIQGVGLYLGLEDGGLDYIQVDHPDRAAIERVVNRYFRPVMGALIQPDSFKFCPDRKHGTNALRLYYTDPECATGDFHMISDAFGRAVASHPED
jgi:hypothetical protein